jgi:hypothetical protein
MIGYSLAARIMENNVVRGVLLCLGVVVAIAAHGRVKYADGYRTGSADAARAAAIDAATARAAFDSSWAVLYSQAAAARDAQRTAEQAAARARTRSAVAEARLTNALKVFAENPGAQITPVCAELADSCANAAALWTHERDTLTALIATQDATILRHTEMRMTEPARYAAALREALARQRETFRAPSRVTWATLGAMVGAVLTLGVVR